MNEPHYRLKDHPLYRRWASMLTRCRNANDPNYLKYGARGISVCSRWLSFKNFADDMGVAPAGFQIERIDNNGNYCPQNCRWASTAEQARNKRNNHILEHGGKKQCLADWAKDLNISTSTLLMRLRSWSVQKTLTTPLRKSINGVYFPPMDEDMKAKFSSRMIAVTKKKVYSQSERRERSARIYRIKPWFLAHGEARL